jgi:hypothetical protein
MLRRASAWLSCDATTMLGMSSSLITLAAGGLGGVAVKAVFDLFNQGRLWRREDQHRFASTKQEL